MIYLKFINDVIIKDFVGEMIMILNRYIIIMCIILGYFAGL